MKERKRSAPLQAALYVALLFAMVFSAYQLYAPKAKAEGVCCQFTTDCRKFGGHSLCCPPVNLMDPCSPGKPNYCLAVCPT
jgi:hypothetical protein